MTDKPDIIELYCFMCIEHISTIEGQNIVIRDLKISGSVCINCVLKLEEIKR